MHAHLSCMVYAKCTPVTEAKVQRWSRVFLPGLGCVPVVWLEACGQARYQESPTGHQLCLLPESVGSPRTQS